MIIDNQNKTNGKYIRLIRKFKFALVIFLLIFLLNSNTIKCYASFVEDRLKYLYEPVETEWGILYKEKAPKVHVSHSISNKVFEKENEKAVEVIKNLITDYAKETYVNIENTDKIIAEDYKLDIVNIYSITDEKKYSLGDEIVTLVTLWVKPVDIESSFWQDNFTNNDFHYDVRNDETVVTMDFYMRLVFNEDTEFYEIAYIDYKPENLEDELERLKKQGLDLKNLDIKKLLEVEYGDEIKVVSNSSTSIEKVNANKIDYNSKKLEEVSKITITIRVVCIVIISLMSIVLIKASKKKKYKK